MDYSLDESQAAVSGLASEILQARSTRDRFAELDTGATWFDEDLWRELASAGLVGIAVPEELGGSGAGFTELCLLVEQAARSAAQVFVVEPLVLAAMPLVALGTAEQHRRLLAPFCAGDLVLTSALRCTNERGGELRAERTAEGWRLSGSVGHVPLADVAARMLVEASDDQGRRGLFLLDPAATGVSLSPQTSVDRKARWHVTLSMATVATDDVVREPGALSTQELQVLRDHAVAATAISALGSCEAALAMTAGYVTERKQFGRPVGTFQAVAQRLADAYIDVTGIRLTAWRAAWLLAEGTRDDDALATAAWWTTDAASRVVESAMHLHGGISVDMEYPLHRHYLAVKQAELALGGPSRRLEALGAVLAVSP